MNTDFSCYETEPYTYSITFCPICHGAKSVYNFHFKKNEYNSELAATLAKRSFEHNGFPKCTFACVCQQKAAEFKILLDKENVKITNDSGWQKSGISKSLVEYTRKITLHDKLSKEQINIITGWLKYDNSPGINNVWLDLKSSQNTNLVFKTIWDFSD